MVILNYNGFIFGSCDAATVNVELRSEGCNDKGKGPGCGRAYIWVNGKDRSRHHRGINAVVLNYRTGKPTEVYLFSFAVI